MPAYHSITTDEVFMQLKTDERGLTESEAQERLLRYGENALHTQKRGSAIKLFLAQFKDFMTVLLICAAFISGTIAYITGDIHGIADTGILLFIILLNTIVGFIQQYRADHAVEKLKRLSVCRVKAVRNGKDCLLSGNVLVPGDIIYLEEGDMVPADCRILSAEEFYCDESALTGESNPIAKSTKLCSENAVLGDRTDMVYSSTFALRGQAKALVTATGVNTELGKIAGMLTQTKESKTPLEKVLAVLGKIITWSVISIAFVIFVFGIFFKNNTLLGNFMSSVAVAVAAIPEGMPAIVTVIMALGVQRMSKERAIVRKLHAVETLGGCSCICSDKTGTLTENRMTVETVWLQSSNNGVSQAKNAETDSKSLARMLECMRVCNTVKQTGTEYSGDPTEIALMNFADATDFQFAFQRMESIPFSSERKMMTVAAKTAAGTFCYTKGGADILSEHCTRILDNGIVRPITSADRGKILAETDRLASEALRVLGFAYREYNGEISEQDLIFIGICGMIDPPKKGVKEAVAECIRAGIIPIMITGDHSNTAFAIARRLGIARSESQVLTGKELDNMSPPQFSAAVSKARVFARVTPSHKSRIVAEFQKAGHVVAMTGDGINDAPGIRKADIGIAMGISGTDVTRSAADMVLADDNFSTIVTAVREGRHVFSNIKKTIQFFLATNLAEVLSILTVTLALWKLNFLTSTQLLWINLITDSLPVLSLSSEQADADCMLRPPRSPAELFSAESMVSVIFYGVVQTAICVGSFVWSAFAYGNDVAVTVTFFVLSFLELFHSFNIRSERGSAFGKNFFGNKMLFLTVFLGIAVNLLLMCFAPLRAAFSVVQLSFSQWAAVFFASLLIIPAAEIYKASIRVFCKKNRMTYIKKSNQKSFA